MKEYYIYALVDKEGVIFYVGQSYSIEGRMAVHKRNYSRFNDYFIVDSINGNKTHALLLERKWIQSYLSAGHPLINKQGVTEPEPWATESTRIDKEIHRMIKIFVAEYGGNIRKVLEFGAKHILGNGKDKYIKELKDIQKTGLCG
jgi:hypothetical protein